VKKIKNIFLASNSPRRKAIFSFLGVDFDVLKIDADESFHESDPSKICIEICKKKLSAAKKLLEPRDLEESLVVVADTLVFHESKPLGKPKSRDEAKKMLRLLSGQSHKVITAIGFSELGTDDFLYDITNVRFIELTDGMINYYLDQNNFLDKAGAYGIQSEDCFFVESIQGSFSNVVGFPIELFRSKIKL
jgi:septum formation protein